MSLGNWLKHYLILMENARKETMMNKQKIWKNHFLIIFLFGFVVSFSSLAVAKIMNLEINDAKVLHFDGDVTEVFIANPDIADVQLTNPHAAYVYGKAAGRTRLFAVDSKGKEVLNAEINVIYDISQLKEMIAPFDPYGLIEIKSIPGAIVLEGQADSPKTAEEIRMLAEKFVTKPSSTSGSSGSSDNKSDKSKDQTIINRLVIKSPVQVSLRVKIAEVARSVLNNFGINWQAAFANIGKFNFAALTGRTPLTGGTALISPLTNTTNVLTMVPNTTIIPGTNTTLSSIGANFTNSHVDVNAVIDLLAQDGLVTVLAEPNLMAISGETASFLAGGEFPYPVPQQLGNITIEFKQYGVSLAFTPTVLDGRLISMRVRPEVSELDQNTGVQINGTFVPGILTRWAETTVELASGQTFAIAGLLHNTSKSFINALPGLGDLPVLGALFRSNQFQRGDSELVILITPYLVEPAAGKEMLLPTDNLQFATFVEMIFERRILKQGVQKGKAPAFGPGGIRLIGPAGFSVD
jgi:pilus assembly protein CpaC